MLKLVFLVCVVGYVVSQAPAGNPFGFGMIPEGCDITALQQCVQPLMEQGAIMARRTDMSVGFSSPSVDTVCRVITTFKNCAMPKLASCGREIMMVANATVKALNYMCVEARAETEQYYQCLARGNDTVSQMNECVNHFMVSQMEMASAIRSNSQSGNLNLLEIKTKLCSNLNSYEQCLENKAGYLCGEKEYVTKLFGLFNEGLRFLNCRNLGSTTNLTSKSPFDKHFSHRNFSSHGAMPRMPPIVMEMQCVGTHFEKCLSPLMVAAKPSAASVERICSMYQEYSLGCLSRDVPSACATKARIAVYHFKKMAEYLCGEAKQDLENSMSCFVREVPQVGMKCMKPMMSPSMVGKSFLKTGRINEEMEEHLCKAEKTMQSCLSGHIEKHCGEQASNMLSHIYPMYSDMTNDLVGLDCHNRDVIADSYIVQCFGPRHGRTMMIILPIAGLLVLAIIIAVTVVICRRRRNRRNLRKTEDKSDLVKNDVLQQNLRFAITQTPKEKSVDSLKI